MNLKSVKIVEVDVGLVVGQKKRAWGKKWFLGGKREVFMVLGRMMSKVDSR